MQIHVDTFVSTMTKKANVVLTENKHRNRKHFFTRKTASFVSQPPGWWWFQDLQYKKFTVAAQTNKFSEQLVYKRKQLWAKPCLPLLCEMAWENIITFTLNLRIIKSNMRNRGRTRSSLCDLYCNESVGVTQATWRDNCETTAEGERRVIKDENVSDIWRQHITRAVSPCFSDQKELQDLTPSENYEC